MTAADWIALLGAFVSAIAIVVSASIARIAVKLQARQGVIEREQADLDREQAAKDAKKHLADVARELSHKMAQLSMLPMGPEATSLSAEVAGLVITARDLAGDDGGDWYLYYGLAMAHGWMWEIDKATECWEKALSKADSGHTRITLLNGKGYFLYNVGSPAAIEEGRACLSEAARILDNESPDDLGREQRAGILGQQAGLEYNVGQRDVSAAGFAKAWEQVTAVTTRWRQERASYSIATTFLMTFGREQLPLPPVIPAALIQYAAFLQQTQQPGYGQPAVVPPQAHAAQQVAPQQFAAPVVPPRADDIAAAQDAPWSGLPSPPA